MSPKRRAAASAPKVSARPVAVSSHDRILHTAKRLFSERGYDNTSTSAIARQAGTSESQLMKHFGSKEGLLEAIFLEGWGRISQGFPRLEELDSPVEKLRALTEAILDGLESDPALQELMLLEGRRVRKEGHAVMMTPGFLDLPAMLDGLLEQMRAAGQLRPELHPQAVRSALIGAFEALLRDRLLAARMNYPAHYSAAQLRQALNAVIAAFVPVPALR